MQFFSTTLANGLTVIAEVHPQAHSAAVGFVVNTGSRDEAADEAGLSHFLEHMVFKGTERRTAEDVNREFDELGAQYNAATSEEQTVYYASVLPEYIPPVLELWADILRPALREDDFETEKQVILEEIQMYQDMPPYGSDDRVKELFFGTHPLAGSILGTPASVGALRAEQMQRYFLSHYSPANIVLAAAGKLNFDDFVAEAERVCGRWSGPPVVRRMQPLVAPQGLHEFLPQDHSSQQYIMQLMAGPAGSGLDRYAAALLSVILGDDSGSRLYWALVDDGRAEAASLSYQEFADCGIFGSYLCCSPEVADENLATMEEVFRQAAAEGLQQLELDQAKNKVSANLVLSSERPRSRLFKVAGDWIRRGEYRTVQEDLAAIEAVTLDDLHRLLADYPLTNATTVSTGPQRPRVLSGAP